MRIAVAMSGGVDSSVAAFELKEKGHDINGVTIQTWAESEHEISSKNEAKVCCSLEALHHAKDAADKLGIPHYVIDLSKEFAKEIEGYFVSEYLRGRTPNPCIYCNSRIKFGFLLDRIREMGISKIATGHYARILKINNYYYLAEAKDKQYDQSYFLCTIPREVLPFIEFPLGETAKKEVQEIALKHNFMSAHRRSSQDICFADAREGYREYLNRRGVKNAFLPGDILDLSGKVIGKHKGVALYTIGQRRGLALAREEAVYVLKIDAENNTITVGEKPYAMKSKIRVAGLSWLIPENPAKPRRFLVKIRYNSTKEDAGIEPCGNRECIVHFKEPQFAPTPGQAAVFYEDDIVAGSGWIEEILE